MEVTGTRSVYAPADCPSVEGNAVPHPDEGWQRARFRQMLNLSAMTAATSTFRIRTRLIWNAERAGDCLDLRRHGPRLADRLPKVATADGGADVSQVIAAIDWAVQHRYDNGLDIRVINLSYGTNSLQAYQADPLAY